MDELHAAVDAVQGSIDVGHECSSGARLALKVRLGAAASADGNAGLARDGRAAFCDADVESLAGAHRFSAAEDTTAARIRPARRPLRRFVHGDRDESGGPTTHAVYVFVTMLRKLIADHDPAFIAASFDLAGRRFAMRSPPTTRPTARDARRSRRADQLGAPGVRSAGRADPHQAGYEADDVINDGDAGGGRRASGRDRVDRQGLLSARSRRVIRVYDPREDGAWFDEQGVVEKFGVKPSQVVDVLALVGDTSDNVAGVPGIGKKGAIDLITQFGGLDALLARAAELKPKQREALDHRIVTRRCGAASW